MPFVPDFFHILSLSIINTFLRPEDAQAHIQLAVRAMTSSHVTQPLDNCAVHF